MSKKERKDFENALTSNYKEINEPKNADEINKEPYFKKISIYSFIFNLIWCILFFIYANDEHTSPEIDECKSLLLYSEICKYFIVAYLVIDFITGFINRKNKILKVIVLILQLIEFLGYLGLIVLLQIGVHSNGTCGALETYVHIYLIINYVIIGLVLCCGTIAYVAIFRIFFNK